MLAARRNSTWRSRYFSAVPAGTRINAGEFDEIFGKELDRLAKPAADPDAPPTTLRETAQTLADLGVPLAHLVIAGSAWRDAICEILGPSLAPAVEAAVAELDALRAKTYAEVYAARESYAACARPVVNLRKKEDDDAFELIGQSPAMERLREQISDAGQARGSLLILGEPGTGKELVARAVHAGSGLERSAFLRLTPSVLSPHVVDSELFGHVGRDGDKRFAGLLRSAEGGTLFIDEVTALSPEVQAKLVHVLLEGKMRPVGGAEDEPVHVRVIASTSRDLDEAVAAGVLRGDLASALKMLTIEVPPLRERRSDIPLLCEHFLTTFCHRRCGCIFAISDRAMQLLLSADWPGNDRELRSAIEHAVSNGEGGVVRVEDLPAYLWHGRGVEGEGVLDRLPTLAEAEEQLIRATLKHFEGNKLRAAKSLGISRHKLYDRLRKLGL